MKRRLLAMLLVFAMCLTIPVYAETSTNTAAGSTASQNETGNGTEVKASSSSKMTEKQLSSISMLNYLTVLTQEINSSSNSKIFLDNAYSAIVNNINPNAVDEDSMSEIRVLLNTIYAYQSIETKRERLQYIYEQNQAQAIQKAIPDPMDVLNVVQSKNPVKALISVVYMAVDSKSSYDSYMNDVETKYLEDGWTLDTSAKENLHESRTDAFTYMVEMCQKNGLDGKLALTENAVNEFVSWENNSNITRRVDFLEKNKSTYQAYGKYWLVLAESYYEQAEYEKCLDAITEYEALHINTFRYDTDYAKTLTIGLVAADEIYSGDQYKTTAEHFLEEIRANINTSDWTLRYLAAQGYVDLYTNFGDEKYLQSAFDLAEENINYLIDEQYAKNDEYLEAIKKEEIKKTDSKETKNEKKAYNDLLEDERKVALPPVYQPLVVNCDLLFSLAEKINISEKEKTKINNMLHQEDKPLFLVKQLENKYWFNYSTDTVAQNIEFDGKTLKIPAAYLVQGTTIQVTVTDNGQSTTYNDWALEKVTRGKNGGIDTFIATYTSKSIKKQDYEDGDTVKVEIIPAENSSYDTLTCKLRANVTKKLKVITDLKFEMVP